MKAMKTNKEAVAETERKKPTAEARLQEMNPKQMAPRSKEAVAEMKAKRSKEAVETSER